MVSASCHLQAEGFESLVVLDCNDDYMSSGLRHVGISLGQVKEFAGMLVV